MLFDDRSPPNLPRRFQPWNGFPLKQKPAKPGPAGVSSPLGAQSGRIARFRIHRTGVPFSFDTSLARAGPGLSTRSPPVPISMAGAASGVFGNPLYRLFHYELPRPQLPQEKWLDSTARRLPGSGRKSACGLCPLLSRRRDPSLFWPKACLRPGASPCFCSWD